MDEAVDLHLDADGSSFTWRGHAVRLALGGAFNVANALAAAHAAAALGIDDATIAEGLSLGLVVPGRFELVAAGQPFPVVVDYAHTPDGLEQLLVAADDLVGVGPTGERGRVVVVFGCGGDRDATKRPAMGEVAAERADQVVVTADNSRNEDTGAIIEAVKQGFERVHPRRAAELLVEPDRRAAIALALGRGAPVTSSWWRARVTRPPRTSAGSSPPFDDRVVVAEEWARIGGSAVIRLLVAAAVALTLSLIGTKVLISILERRHIGQPIREDGPQGHITKAGTPTMGGIAIVASAVIAWFVSDFSGVVYTRRGLLVHGRHRRARVSSDWSTTASRSSGSATSASTSGPRRSGSWWWRSASPCRCWCSPT